MDKVCSKCNKTKPASEFYYRKATKSKCTSWCKTCLSEDASGRYSDNIEKSRRKARAYYHSENRFRKSLRRSRTAAKEKGYLPCNATVKQLEAAFTSKCHLCAVPEIECNRRLVMDHDHKTGKFRGFLCTSCNKGLGLLGDSEKALAKAFHYLTNSNEKVTNNE